MLLEQRPNIHMRPEHASGTCRKCASHIQRRQHARVTGHAIDIKALGCFPDFDLAGFHNQFHVIAFLLIIYRTLFYYLQYPCKYYFPMVQNAMTNKAPYRNCYIRPTAKNSESDQEIAIKASGSMTGKTAKTVVEDGKKGASPKLDTLLKTVRGGEFIVVAELQCLGDDMPAVMAALEKIQKRSRFLEKKGEGKLVLLEAATGRTFADPYDGPAAALAADDYFKRRSLSTMAARKAGRKGSKIRWKDADKGQAPLKEAVRRWNEAVDAGATKDEAIAAVNIGYTDWLSYDKLQKRRRDGRLPGALRQLRPGRRRQS